MRPLEDLADQSSRHTHRQRTTDDGRALFAAVCKLGLEGVVAKNHASTYRPGERGWEKVKNPDYW
jgi:ATP-dependent DNA ligase